jgi:hypothetical protein
MFCCTGENEDVISLSMDMVLASLYLCWYVIIFAGHMSKIEKAFKKFDLNGDGYLSWEEFSKVEILPNRVITPTFTQIGLAPGQARRIFLSCSQSSGQISLDQFQDLANSRPGGQESMESAL